MKTKKTLLILGFFFIFSVIYLFGGNDNITLEQIVVTPELKKEFPIKSHHDSLSLECIHCHDGQGNNPREFETPGDKGCLSCHKNKEYLANRLVFMDDLHANPHNSIHDGPNLFCDECHNEHKPSINMCAECHEHDIKIWMKETP
ncbi:MAG: cytochrome C [Arcobacter sp.]|nr:MAG: cytochrome C [Arcobacter sp.]